MDMEAARIHALPNEGFYISDFVTAEEEDLLLQKVSEYNTSVKQNTCANMTMFFVDIRLLLRPVLVGLIYRIVVSKRILQL